MTYDVVDRLRKDVEDALERLHAVERTLGLTPSQPTTSKPVSQTNISLPSALKVIDEAYENHLFVKASDPLSATPHQYNISHEAEFVILQGTYDYQFELDQHVTPSTPITPALIYAQMPVKTKKYIQYQLSPDVVQNLGSNTKGDFYIFMFWHESDK